MKKLYVPGVSQDEVSTAWHAVAHQCGSLGFDVKELADALASGDLAAMRAAAEAGIAQAIPEEGEIHPQRAELLRVENDLEAGWSLVTFRTPGGVEVEIAATSHLLFEIVVTFNRDSHCLAGDMLAGLMSCYLRDQFSQWLAERVAEWGGWKATGEKIG